MQWRRKGPPSRKGVEAVKCAEERQCGQASTDARTSSHIVWCYEVGVRRHGDLVVAHPLDTQDV